jgi:EAL domain-containing protein (putative c-di-GMP-specific phosphodiesterase class I)/GGDEF domain-containing protein
MVHDSGMTMTQRIGLLLGSVLALALLGSLAIHALAARDVLRVQLEVRNHDAAAALALALSQQHGDLPAMQAVAAAQFDLGHYSQLALTAANGQRLIERRADERVVRAPAWFVQALPIAAPPGTAQVSDGWRDIGRLQVQSQAVWAHEALWSASVRTALLLAMLAGAAAVLAVAALRAWHKPLAATMAQAQALEQGRFVTADEPSLPELRSLTRSMNAMVVRLREVFDAQAAQVALLQRQAHADAVTGLPQRRQFVGRLNSALSDAGAPAAALLILRVLQLDDLNQRLGHEGTDRVLAAVGDVLLTYVDRVNGTFAGRLNGSDFALCLPAPGVAHETAQSLHAALAASPACRAGGAEWVVGGVDGLRAVAGSAALAEADAALAQAEAGGSVVVEAHADALAALAGARSWRDQIGQALKEGRVQLAEFDVIDARGALLHLECPLRVQLQPGGDFHAARRWLALAARSRLLPQVDLAAAELALQAIATDGRPRSVHVSPAALAATGFVAALQAKLEAAPRCAGLLWIELVDGQRATLADELAGPAAGWRRLGVRVGVEHAGALPQTLPALQRAGLDYVKVDARHLRGVASDAVVREYAQSLLALIRGLNLTALAEGIDDPRDLVAVWALGFDGATGPAVMAAI